MGEVGSVVSVAGTVVAVLDGTERILKAGSTIYEGEVIRTEAGANVEVRFDDETVLSQGPDSELTVDSYVYNPNAPSQSSFLFKMAQGTYRMATGQIAEDNPDGVRLESPLATIGIRGTTTVSQILPNGQELHAAESLTGGRSIIIADQFGNQQLITFPSGGVPMAPGAPMGAVFTVPQSVFNAIRAGAPLTTQGEPPAPGADGGVPPEDGQLPDPDVPADDGGTGDPAAGDGGDGGDGTGNGEGDGTGGENLDPITGDPTLLLPDDGLNDGGGDPNRSILDDFMDASGQGDGQGDGDSGGTDDFFDQEDDDLQQDLEDALEELGGINFVFGTAEADTLVGSEGNDLMYGLAGDDVLVGLGSGVLGDVLNGGAGWDTLYGGGEGQESRLEYAGELSTTGTITDGASADIDGDGYNDIVMLRTNGSSNDLVWFSSSFDPATGEVYFTEHVVQAGISTAATSSLAVGDLDGDGDVDVAVSTSDSILVYENTGGSLVLSDTVASGLDYEVESLTIADVDNDGTPDLVARPAQGGDLVWYDQSAGWTPQIIYASIGAGSEIAVAEVDPSNAYQEVVFATDGQIKVSAFDGSSWGSLISVANGDLFVLGDFNGDGMTDLVAATAGSSSMTLVTEHDEYGRFIGADTLGGGDSVDIAAAGNLTDVVAVNLNSDLDAGGDTLMDLLISTDSQVYAVMNQGDGSLVLDETPLISGLSNIDGLEVGDFDGDGIADDVAVHFQNSATVMVYANLFTEAHMNTVDYSDHTEGMSVDLEYQSAINSGETEVDYLYLIDHVIGSDYDDEITGNAYANQLSGGDGDDYLYGMAGSDTLWGQDGNDHLYGGVGNDLLNGGEDGDTLQGDAGDDSLLGGTGDDIMDGGDGSDVLWGEDGSDLLMGGAGFDTLNGGSGNDTLYGYDNLGTSATVGDELRGGDGDDVLHGTCCIDFLVGGAGADTLDGGSSQDFFHYTSQADGGDTITQFVSGQDMLSFESSEFGGLTHSTFSSDNFYNWNVAAEGGFSYEGQTNIFGGNATCGFVYVVDNASSTGGTLYFDPDASVSGDEIQIADLTQGTAGSAGVVQYTDFIFTS